MLPIRATKAKGEMEICQTDQSVKGFRARWRGSVLDWKWCSTRFKELFKLQFDYVLWHVVVLWGKASEQTLLTVAGSSTAGFSLWAVFVMIFKCWTSQFRRGLITETDWLSVSCLSVGCACCVWQQEVKHPQIILQTKKRELNELITK